MTTKPPHKGIPVPPEYIEMMRHYIPKLPMPAIRQAWLHNATPLEVMRTMDRSKA